MQEIAKKKKTITYLVCSSPVSFILLQHPFPEHGHHFWKLLVRECGLSQFLHHCPLKSNAFRIINLQVFHVKSTWWNCCRKHRSYLWDPTRHR